MTYLLLAIGGIAGALCRFHGARLAHTTFPLGTFVINLSGSFALGLLAGLLGAHPAGRAQQASLLLGTGFCGAFTTFSSFGFETVQLWRAGRTAQALFNLLSQPLLGCVLVWMGWLVGSALRRS